jgi:hypothetical protein
MRILSCHTIPIEKATLWNLFSFEKFAFFYFRSCHNDGGSARMIFITRNAQSFPSKIVKYAAHVSIFLYNLLVSNKYLTILFIFNRFYYHYGNIKTYTIYTKKMALKNKISL